MPGSHTKNRAQAIKVIKTLQNMKQDKLLNYEKIDAKSVAFDPRNTLSKGDAATKQICRVSLLYNSKEAAEKDRKILSLEIDKSFMSIGENYIQSPMLYGTSKVSGYALNISGYALTQSVLDKLSALEAMTETRRGDAIVTQL